MADAYKAPTEKFRFPLIVLKKGDSAPVDTMDDGVRAMPVFTKLELAREYIRTIHPDYEVTAAVGPRMLEQMLQYLVGEGIGLLFDYPTDKSAITVEDALLALSQMPDERPQGEDFINVTIPDGTTCRARIAYPCGIVMSEKGGTFAANFEGDYCMFLFNVKRELDEFMAKFDMKYGAVAARSRHELSHFLKEVIAPVDAPYKVTHLLISPDHEGMPPLKARIDEVLKVIDAD